MDGDPWDWSTQKVGDFFLNRAHTITEHLSNSQLPELTSFAQSLIDNGVVGWMLLTAVDMMFLRHECHISSIRVQSTILHCIRKLRAESDRYAREYGFDETSRYGDSLKRSRSSTAFQTSTHPGDLPGELAGVTPVRTETTSIQPLENAVIEAPTRPSASASATPIVDNTDQSMPTVQPVNANDQNDELPFDEARGRKRLKLNSSHAVNKPSNSVLPTTYFENGICSVDQVFFGNTLLGQEILDFQLDDEIYTPEDSDRNSTDNFQFHSLDRPPNQRHYVWGRLRHFLAGPEVKQLERHNRIATAVLPYQTKHVIADKPRSAIVFQTRNRRVQAVRENAALIQGDYDYQESDSAAMPTRWDYLVDKYKDQVVLPAYGISEHDDEMSISSSDSDEEDPQDLPNDLSEQMKSDIIDSAINKFVCAWKEKKLPHLEELYARRKGKKVEGGRKRDRYVGAARADVKEFQDRLAKFKVNIMKEQTEQSLRTSCENLEVTVHNREEALWKVKFWQRQTDSDLIYSRATAKSSTRPCNQKSTIHPDGHSDHAIEDRENSVSSNAPEPEPEQTYTSETPPPVSVAPAPATIIEPVDLTYSSQESSQPRPKIVIRRQSLEASYEVDPLGSKYYNVEAWDFKRLAHSRDGFRILIKLLFFKEPSFRDSLFDCSKRHRRQGFLSTLRFIIRRLKERPAQVTPQDHDVLLATIQITVPNFKHKVTIEEHRILKECAWVAVAWYFRLPDIALKGTPLTSHQWATLLPNIEFNMDVFVDTLGKVLEKRNTTLFRANEKRATDAIVLSSDDEGLINTPRKGHKPVPVEMNKASKKTRDQALKRQEMFNSVVASQLATPSTSVSKSQITINPAKKETEKDLYIPSNIGQLIKPHQIDGIRFMWREITNNGSDNGQGCVLAHTMGLGKTMQTITFLAALNEAAHSDIPSVNLQLPSRLRLAVHSHQRQLRMLILAPPALLLNWKKEIEFWTPQALGDVFIIDSVKDTWTRIRDIETWHHRGGVLLIGYSLFRDYVQRREPDDPIARILLHDPEIAVADEAHMLKNAESQTARSVSRLRTRSRIGLTGTPMSNVPGEIYSVISFVAPNYLADPAEFNDRFAKPIIAAEGSESSEQQRRHGAKKLRILRNEIEPIVNRADITVLKGSLKPKVEYVITLQLSEIQRYIFDRLVDLAHSHSKIKPVNVIYWGKIFKILVNHPTILRNRLIALRDDLNKKLPRQPKCPQDLATLDDMALSEMNEPAEGVDSTEDLIKQAEENANDFRPLALSDAELDSLITAIPYDTKSALSAKMCVFLDILKLSKNCGDKVLVFSTSLPTLDYIGSQLDGYGYRYMRIDGSTVTSKRPAMAADFKSDPNICVMLISTRAGGTGLNMEAANRVVIFDFDFNPVHEKQAIGRAYRLGQQKPVFVYRFVTGDTFEERIYHKQLFKDALTLRIVDNKNPLRLVDGRMQEYFYKIRPPARENLKPWVGKDPNVLDLIIPNQKLILALSTMETLQEDIKDDIQLTAEDEREIQTEIAERNSKRARGRQPSSIVPPLFSNPARPMLRLSSGNGMLEHESARNALGGLPTQ